ncbi:unnamed protein product [Calypogeia fissa]
MNSGSSSRWGCCYGSSSSSSSSSSIEQVVLWACGHGDYRQRARGQRRERSEIERDTVEREGENDELEGGHFQWPCSLVFTQHRAAASSEAQSSEASALEPGRRNSTVVGSSATSAEPNGIR